MTKTRTSNDANNSIMLKKSAVLVPVYRRNDGEVMVVLVRRSEGDSHGGQIAFPGGKVSKSDKTLLDTALREADEEIGLPAENVQIIR
ncbi:MAG: CoA pyrophosphatase, partial [candidate division Zixibacteria bacterium]